MYRSPNLEYLDESNVIIDTYERGDNHIEKRFDKALDVLLTPDYFEGTKLGKYYNEIDSDGYSTVYVRQPKMEKRLREWFLDRQEDSVMFLVGYTGVGKTTLLRNFFHVFDRKIAHSDGNLIIYLSFYATGPDTQNESEESIMRIIRQSINMACTDVAGCRSYAEMVRSYNEDSYRNIYEFIENNNSNLAHGSYDPLTDEELDDDHFYRGLLAGIQKRDPLDYSMSLLKYYLDTEKKSYNNIIFIFDDLEVLSEAAREEAMRLAMHIKKCMQAFEQRSFQIKILIALRYYTFRMHTIREMEAFRFIVDSDVILKDMVPTIGEILSLRLDQLLKNEDIKKVRNKDSYKKACDTLLIVLEKMYLKYDRLLLDLTHYNIFASMKLLARIVTNKRYFGESEKDNKGGFGMNPDDYRTNSNASVLFSLAYGEKECYVDYGNYYLTNILHYRRKENAEAECLGIYVIQYLIKNKKCVNNLNYQVSTLTSEMVIDDLMSLFDYMPLEKEQRYREAFNYTMRYLYENGVLLQSLKEPVVEDSDKYKRIYRPDIKIYLSLRGYRLYDMLSANSLLLEIYRDDIDTDFEDNDILTRKIESKEEVFRSCLEYAEHVFTLEQELFMQCSDREAVADMIGSRMVCVVLMQGIRESIKTYTWDDESIKEKMIREFNIQAKYINRFIMEFMNTGNRELFENVKLLLGRMRQ